MTTATRNTKTTAEQQAAARKRPTSIDDFAPDEEMTEEESRQLEGNMSGAQKLQQIAQGSASAVVQDAPAWANLPPGLIIPRDVEVSFLQVPLRSGSEMVLVRWELGVRDERFARARAMGDGMRIVEEMAKQMIRVVDDAIVTWTNPVFMEKVWDQIGGKYRNVLVAYYMKLHNLDDEERVDFFTKRVVARRAV